MTSTSKWTNVKLLAVVIFCSAFISAGVFAGQMPYEKGVRILPGQWRPHCPYEHIAWISPSWPSRDYVWLDFPEAIFVESELIFLGHASPVFMARFRDLPKVEWQNIPGGIAHERVLPNGLKFGASAVKNHDSTGAELKLYIENGTKDKLKDIKLQTCAYLRALKEFTDFTADNKFVHLRELGWQQFEEEPSSDYKSGRFRVGWRAGPASADLPVMVTLSNAQQRLVALTWYDNTYSLVSNPQHPCMHADPFFPDLEPGQRVEIRGELLFFEGTIEQFEPWFRKRYNQPKVKLLWPDGAPGSEGIAKGQTEEIFNRSDTVINRSVSNAHKPSLTVYLPPKDKNTGTAVVVCPGGAYTHLAIDKEGYDVAKWLNSLGVATFVLKYRLRPHYERSHALQDAQRAVRMVRSRAEEWDIDPNRIGILGFSAGGHLASNLAMHFHEDTYEPKDTIDKVSGRPDFMILGYTSTTLSDESPVTAQIPPTFLFCSSDDGSVPAQRSVNFYLALREADVPAEMHIYEKGGHGFGLGVRGGAVTSWPARCAGWMRERQLLDKK
jgi:acetyl esterase/lipase